MNVKVRVKPITVADLIEFRQLLVGHQTSESAARVRLGEMLGVAGMSVWRWEQGERIQHPVVLRLALSGLAYNLGVTIPNRLRVG